MIKRRSNNKAFIWALAGVLVLCLVSCSTEDSVANDDPQMMDEAISSGRLNAQKKAYQMTDIVFTPKDTIKASKIYEPGTNYTGVVYSSVKEIETYVGDNVSFYTYMTAINNPKSKIYTEEIDKYPYHGRTPIKCRAYYGTVCSGLVCYALGISPRLNTYDFSSSVLMEQVDTIPEKLEIGDILWRSKHVALISNIIYDNENVSKIEICECNRAKGSTRYLLSREEFTQKMNNYERIYRYKEIYKNQTYLAIPEFVAVGDETSVSFSYNNELGLDKGDKSNYMEGDSVIINVFRDYDYVEIQKDGSFYEQIPSKSNLNDIVLRNLPYGTYQAKIVYNGGSSDVVSWIVVNAEIQYEKGSNRVFFKSNNATPDHVICCDITGLRPKLSKGFWINFSNDDISQGYFDLDEQRMDSDYPFIQICFKTEYGKIIYKPFKWTE